MHICYCVNLSEKIAFGEALRYFERRRGPGNDHVEHATVLPHLGYSTRLLSVSMHKPL
jgi:hypothetical protein